MYGGWEEEGVGGNLGRMRSEEVLGVGREGKRGEGEKASYVCVCVCGHGVLKDT